MMECAQSVPFNAPTTEVYFFTLNWGKEREEHKHIEKWWGGSNFNNTAIYHSS